MKILVTGGAGFIGSAVIRYLISKKNIQVLNIDKLTYAGNLESLRSVSSSKLYSFEQVDICEENKIKKILNDFNPDKVMHLAAESHVDRSIDGPAEFIRTNIFGTFCLLETCRNFYENLKEEKQANFRFHHISTDEVYGDLDGTDALFTESTPYAPSSPYSASKASSDHLVRAWNRTFGFPVVITNCSNNYGPYHFPEKLIPLIIINALKENPLPVYGKGEQIRDWLYVDDHAKALVKVLLHGKDGETYNIGGFNEKRNIDVVKTICKILDDVKPISNSSIRSYSDLINFVADRPGHDARYAIDSTKINRELGWSPEETFDSGIRKTILWYLENENWWSPLVKEKQSRINIRTKG